MEAAKVLAGYSLGEADLLRRAMGKKIQSRDGRPARRASSTAARVNGIAAGQGQRAVRLDRQVRRLRLQQEPRRRLRAGRLPDRLAEGAPPRRILRRVDELRHGPDRQAGAVRRGHAPRRGRVPAARHQRQPRRLLGRGRKRSAMPWARSRASARKRWRRWSPSARPTGRSPASTISPSGSTRGCSTAASSRASPPPARSTRSTPTAPRSTPPPRPSSPTPPAPPTSATSGQAALFGGDGHAGVAPIRLPRDARWTLAQRMAAERDAFGFYFSAHPVDAQRHLLAAHKVRTFAELAAMPASADGGRSTATMAGLVEEARWRTSARGPPLPDGDAQRFVGPVCRHRVRRRAVRGARGGGQVRRLRADDRRARPPARRRGAAGHRQALPAARRAGQARRGWR